MQNDQDNNQLRPQQDPHPQPGIIMGPSNPQPSMHTSSPFPTEPDPIKPTYESVDKPRVKSSRGFRYSGLFSMIQLVIGAVILAFFINKVIFQSYEVFGQSMIPTLHEGDRLIISKVGKSWSSLFGGSYLPKRGEIIVFHNPNNTSIQLVKRVVGLPGDRVVVEDGKLTIFTPENPQGLDFNNAFKLKLADTVGNVDLNVPEGSIFVVGDNRTPGGSLDSRNELGTVPLDKIVGDLVIRIFPVNDVRVF